MPAPTHLPTRLPAHVLTLPADGYVRLYRFLEGGRRIELLHKTAVEGVPGAMAAFKGRLLVGVDASLRLYDMGACAAGEGGAGGFGGHWQRAGRAPVPGNRPLPCECKAPRCVCCAAHCAAPCLTCPPPPPPLLLPLTGAAGKKRLLRKCEYRRLPSRVATLTVAGSRVYAGDGQESVSFLKCVWVVGGRVGGGWLVVLVLML